MMYDIQPVHHFYGHITEIVSPSQDLDMHWEEPNAFLSVFGECMHLKYYQILIS